MLLWHATFTVNSLAHVFGRRRYATEDTSRNSVLIALLTLGEGWHNNHHNYQASARQGFFWWELDVSFYVLKVLSWVGIVRDMKVPSAQVKAANRIKDGTFDIGMFRNHWNKANRAVHEAHASLNSCTRSEDTGEALAARRLALEAGLREEGDLEGFVHHLAPSPPRSSPASAASATASWVRSTADPASVGIGFGGRHPTYPPPVGRPPGLIVPRARPAERGRSRSGDSVTDGM
jgi:hypothetical protein